MNLHIPTLVIRDTQPRALIDPLCVPFAVHAGLYAGPAGLKTEGGRWTFENGDGDRRTLRIVRDGSIWAGTVTENNVLYFSNMELAPNGNFKTGPTRMFAW